MPETHRRGALAATAEVAFEPALDAAVAAVRSRAAAWAATGVAQRIALLERLTADVAAQSRRWVEAACVAKAIEVAAPVAGEEWLSGPALVLRNLRLLRRTLRDIDRGGLPRLPRPAYARPDGQVVLPVFPVDRYDALLYRGFSAEVWLNSEASLAEVPLRLAKAYARENAPEPRVALVLGAGNISAIPPLDALYKLFADGCVVVLKLNPVNDYLRPILDDALRALVDAGFLRIVGGGSAAGRYLAEHPDVVEVHLTGSDATYSALVSGNEQSPVAAKKITAELGNVTPVIVVPGHWSARDLAFSARNIATMLTHNAGYNCATARLLITRDKWEHRGALLDATREELRRTPARAAYYPGAAERFAALLAAHPEAERLSADAPGALPWTLIPRLDPTAPQEICFTTEAFCPVLGEVALDGRTVCDYLDAAVEFANDRLRGTLAATILVHPRSLADPEVAGAVDRAVRDLRYGSIVINHWAAVSFGLGSTTWGAYPGHRVGDEFSGAGVVHNTFLVDRPTKSVVRGPFRMWPTPPWFAGHRRSHLLGERLAAFEAAPAARRVPGLLLAAMRG